MPPDWLAILAACSTIAVVTGLTALHGTDPEAGREITVIGCIGLLCALAEYGALLILGR